MKRVYVPATLSTIAELHEQGSLAVPAAAYAVTPALREWYASGDEEELEYVAFTQAAQAALRLLHRDPGAPRLRVVISADAETVEPSSPGDRYSGAAVRLGSGVPLSAVVSIHVDVPAAEPDVAAAAAATPAAAAGDPDAQLTVDAAEDHELAWYDVSELAQLVG